MKRRSFFPLIITQAEFENWFSRMDVNINHFLQKFEEDTHIRLEPKIESIMLIENWLIGQYESIKQADNPEGIVLLDNVGRFVGETFRKYFGGTWYVDLEDEQHLFYQYAGIIGFHWQDKLYPIYPHAWITASLDRRTGKFITQRFEQYLNR